jgi:hypothetical protein
MVEQSRLYPVNLLLNDHYCEWRVMAVSRCWPAPQIWTINIVHGLQSAPHPLHPDHIIYHLPVCVCLSVAQISLSMVFISTVIQTGFVYRWWWYTCCAAVSCLLNKPSCHRDSSLGFWVLLLIYPLAAYILS